MMAPLATLLQEARRKTMQLHGAPRASSGHRKVFDAIKKTQPEQAEKAMCEHLQMAEEDLKEIARPKR
jgi:DNA-binding FadR family transcriptional regulator